MKPLPNHYKKYGYCFDLIERDGDVAIYLQSDPETGKEYAYEVFIVQKNEAGNRFGKDMEATESVPNSNQWGKEAFTVVTLADAYRKMELLQDRIDEKAKNAILPVT